MSIKDYIWEAKYKRPGEKSISDTFRRVAKYISSAESVYSGYWGEKFFEIMNQNRFLPGGRILANAGTKIKNLSNCFVLKVRDSRQSIFQELKDAADVYAWGGGIGYNFSHLREKGAPISIGGKSSGVLSFMKLFNETADVIKIRSRRGATMGQLDVSHPEIEDFIWLKSKLTDEEEKLIELMNSEEDREKLHRYILSKKFTHFNISVRISDDFMSAVRENKDWKLISPLNGEVRKVIKAKDLFGQIALSAWSSGDPGVVFIDRIDEDEMMLPIWGSPEGSNPCQLEGTLNVDGDRLHRIGDISSAKFTGEYAWTEDGPSPIYEANTYYFWKTGYKEVVEIITDRGNSIKLTPDHKILVLDNIEDDSYLVTWEDAQNATNKYIVPTSTGMEVIKNIIGKIITSEDVVSIFGYFEKIIDVKPVGEGNVWDFKVKDSFGRNWTYSQGFVCHNCSELYLYPYESCNLGSINLVEHLYKEDNRYRINWVKLFETVRVATRFLDDVVSLDRNIVEKINETRSYLRRIGLGVMGLADLFLLIEIPYGSKESLELAQKLLWFISVVSIMESNYLARVKGPADFWKDNKLHLNYRFIDKVFDLTSNRIRKFMEDTNLVGLVENSKELHMYDGNGPGYPLRNVSWTSIAPTGSLAILAGVSHAIEPYYKLVYKRNLELGEDKVQKVEFIKNHFVDLKLREMGLSESEIARFYTQYSEGGIESVDVLPEDKRKLFVDSHSLSPKEHVDVQSALQEFVSNSISKTVNMPNSATVEDVEYIFMYMWEKRVKSSTIYRDGSKVFQVLN